MIFIREMVQRALELGGYREQEQEEAERARSRLSRDREYARDVETARVDLGMSNRQLTGIYTEPNKIVVNGWWTRPIFHAFSNPNWCLLCGALAGEVSERKEVFGSLTLPMPQAPSAYMRRKAIGEADLPARFDARHLQRQPNGRITLSVNNASEPGGVLASVCSAVSVVRTVCEALAFSEDPALARFLHFEDRPNHIVLLFTGDAFRPNKRGKKRNTTATRFSLLNYGADIFRSDRWVEFSLAACSESHPFMGISAAIEPVG
jgi:hypothetical protein